MQLEDRVQNMGLSLTALAMGDAFGERFFGPFDGIDVDRRARAHRSLLTAQIRFQSALGICGDVGGEVFPSM